MSVFHFRCPKCGCAGHYELEERPPAVECTACDVEQAETSGDDCLPCMVDRADIAGLQAAALHPNKARSKAARKGLHILRTRGHQAPVRPPPKPASRQSGAKPVAEADVFDAVMSGRMDPRDGMAAIGQEALLLGLQRRRRRLGTTDGK